MKFKNIIFEKPLKNSMIIQIILYYLIGNVLFIVFLSSLFYYSSRYIITKKEAEYHNKNTLDTARYITLYIDKLKNIINLMSVDTDVKNFLLTGDKKAETNIEEMINFILENNKSIKTITLIGKNGNNNFSSEKNMDFEISSNMMNEAWYIDALNNSDIPVFNPNQKSWHSANNANQVLSISRNIKNSSEENLGVIVFDVKYETLDSYLNTFSLGKFNDSIILDEKNNIIYYKDFSCFIDRKCVDKFISNKAKPKNASLIEVDIENTNWKLISITKINDLITLRKSFSHIIVAIFLISLMFTSIVAFLTITKLINPLVKLENHIQKFESTLSEFHPDENVSYEISILIEHFNNMIKKIKYLREYEIKALHSQINPHFLYNTLDTIIWMAEFEDSEKVVLITKSLANFFRHSLNNGNEIILLKDEITHVQEYLFIQKQRYEEKLSYFFDVDENLLLFEVPKIIIQPIVENSIYHGIKNISGNGIINIKIYSENEELYISVKDNGIGFTESKKLKKSKIGGVGIKNVDKRIKFYYGERYGIFIKEQNENEKGSEVIIKLPLNIKISD